MRNAIRIIAVCALVLSMAAPAMAKTPSDKLARGIGNIATGILEVPQTIGQEWKESNNAAVGIFAGFFKGMVQAVVRTGSGVWDVLTFPVAIPKDYEPLYRPDYVFDKTQPDKTGSK